MSEWQSILTHPEDDKECLLAVFQDGEIYIADRGGWVEGDVNEEWDEVEDGVSIRLYSEQEEGHWWSNHELIDEPTHWRPLNLKQ